MTEERLVRKLGVPPGGLVGLAHRGVQIVQRAIAVLSSIETGSARGFESRNGSQQGGFGFAVLTHVELAYANRQLRAGDDPGSRRIQPLPGGGHAFEGGETLFLLVAAAGGAAIK